MGILHLDDALAQPHQVGTDPDGTTGHLAHTQGHGGSLGLQHRPRAPGEGCSDGLSLLLAAHYLSQGDLKSQQERGEEHRGEGPQLYHADGHYFVVGTGGFPSDGTSSSQVFHPKPVVLPNDVQEDIPVGKAEPWCGKHSPA